MSLTVQGGKLVMRNGALGASRACCCDKCSGSCDEENACQPSCRCHYTTTTNIGKCYRNGVHDPALTTQAACVDCQTTCEFVECQEYMYVEEGQDCPAGWVPDGWGGCSRTTNPSSCAECGGYCYSEGCTSTGNCGQWVLVPFKSGQCETPNNCCEQENVRLQIVFEVSGLQDGSLTGCGCLDGTYVADVVDWAEWVGHSEPGFNSLGAKLLLQPGCTATDANGSAIPGQVWLEWHCRGTYGLADWGFRQPMQPGQYPLADQMRVETEGAPCVGGSGDSPDYFFDNYANPFFTGCDTTGVYAKITIQEAP